VDVGAETCPHYLTFDAGTIPDGATQFKCCPPERKRLDSGDFGAAWGGIASLQLSLPAVWTAARERGRRLTGMVRATFLRGRRVTGDDPGGILLTRGGP